MSWREFRWWESRVIGAFPIKFVNLWENATDEPLTIWEVFISAGINKDGLRIEVDAERHMYRVIDARTLSNHVRFEGDAWHLACWAAARAMGRGLPWSFGEEYIVPYEIF